MKYLSDFVAILPSRPDAAPVSEPSPLIPTPWQSLVDQDVIIFVGLTGVGKTTTLDAVSALGFTFTLLPNRRTLTDDLLIADLQLADGDPVVAVRDREQRFAYTRRYRELYAGGMAHALAQLAVKVDVEHADACYLFDGLRGVNEVTYAEQVLPRARFIVLTASDFVRVQRLLTRNDAFDQATASNPHAASSDLLGDAASLFTPSEQHHLTELVQNGTVDPAELGAKLKIVMTERQNYDSAASIEALHTVAPKRTLVVDTAAHDPPQVADQIVNFLQSK